MRSVEEVIRKYWPRLVEGEKIPLAPGEMEDPRSRPDLFEPIIGLPVGQSADYGWSLDDGSRIHAQCFCRSDGIQWQLHRDRYDPRDFESSFRHLAFETPVPKLLVAALVGTWAYRTIRREYG